MVRTVAPPRRAEQRMGQIVCGADCHSQHLDPFLRGRTERFEGGQTVRPLWGRMATICKRLWGDSLQCPTSAGRSVTVSKQGWPNHQGTVPLLVDSVNVKSRYALQGWAHANLFLI